MIIKNLDDPYAHSGAGLLADSGFKKFVSNKIPLKGNFRTDSTLKPSKGLPRAHASLLDRYVNDKVTVAMGNNESKI